MERQDLRLKYDQSSGKLDLACSNLNTIPDFVFDLPGLKVLDLSSNKISRIPEAIFFIPKLISLNLSNNKISKIEIRRKDVSVLRSLNLSFNRITTTKGFKGVFPELTELLLDKNKMKSLECDMFIGMSLLRILSISKNQLQVIPSLITKASLLKLVNLSQNKITEFPKPLSALRFLEDLDISSNPLQNIAFESGGFSYLKKLNLYKTSLGLVPKYIFQLKRIELIDLRGLDINRYDLLEASPSIQKIRTKLAVSTYLKFAKKCSSNEVENRFRKQLFELILEQKGEIIDDEQFKESLNRLSKSFEKETLYNTYKALAKLETSVLKQSDQFFLHKSCDIPLYLKNNWTANIGISFVDEEASADYIIFGKRGIISAKTASHLSLSVFLEWISTQIAISNGKRVYIDSLIRASSPEIRRLGIDIVLNRGWLVCFEKEIRTALKRQSSSTPNVLRNLLSNLN